MSQVILFDLDGTLTESGEGITRCVQYALGKMGIAEENMDNLRCFVGPPLKEQFMSYCGFDESQAEQAVAYYRERYTTLGIFENRLYPKIPELLELLKINDKILGVASSKPEVFVQKILQYFEIDGYFQVVTGSNMDGTRTGKAEVIEEALSRLHMENERDKVLMVGDREHDVQGAISCGIQCVGAAYGYGSRKELEDAGAVYIADTVEDLGILASPNDEETTEHVISVRRDSDANEEDTPAQTLKHLDDADANSMQARDKGKNKKRNRKKNKTQMAEQAQNEQAQDEQAQNGQVQNELTQNEQSQNELTQNEPPGEVVLEGRNNYMHPVLRIWRIIYPVLIHYVTALLMVIAFTAYFVLRASGEGQAADPSALAEQVIRSSLYQLIPTSLIAGGICFLFYRRDEKRRKAGFLGRGAGFVWDPPVIWFSVVVLAVAGSQLLNDLINVLDLYKLFPSYAELTNETMAGQPVWLLILTVGVLAPIAEELVFRGLIFHRMKDWMNPVLAIILSSVIFGLYHGNMIQFIYATLLGMILAVVYHRTGTLWIAILAHISANLWSLCASGWWNAFTRNIPYGIFAGLLLEVLLCVIPAYWIFVKNRKINK